MAWTVFGFPVFGGIVPYIGTRRIALNRDGSFSETGKNLIEEEVGYYYVKPWVFEWLGFGFPLTDSYVRLSSTNEVVDAPFDVAGG